jgi:hypothetical protein
VIESARIATRLARLHRLLAHDAAGLERGESLTASLAILRRVLNEHQPSRTPRNSHTAVCRAQAYLDDHFAERVSLDELAARRA